VRFVPVSKRDEKILHLSIIQNAIDNLCMIPENSYLKNAKGTLSSLRTKWIRDVDQNEFSFDCPHKCGSPITYRPDKIVIDRMVETSCPNCFQKIKLIFTKDKDFFRLSVSK